MKKKRNRSQSETVSEEKRVNTAVTPEKTLLKNPEVINMDSKNHSDENFGLATTLKGDTEQEPTLREVLSAINKLHEKFDSHILEFKSVQKDIESLDERMGIVEDCVETCGDDISMIKKESCSMKEDIAMLKDIIVHQQTEIQEMKNQTVDIQARSMRSNLLFHNVPETRNEDCETKVCHELRRLGISEEIHIQRIHRLGKPNAKSRNPRPIVAKLLDKDCEMVMDQMRQHPRDQGCYISRQHPQEIREKRRRMWETAETYKSLDSSCKSKITADGKLYINGQLHKSMFTKPTVHDVIKLTESERGEFVDRHPLFQGKVILEGGSSFTAAVAKVKNIKEARGAYKSFLLAPGRLSARHNIGIYRVTSPETAKTEEDWDDDGEYGSGRVLRNYLHKKNLTNIAVFLSRGTDGTHLGSRRYGLMEEAVESALQRLA